jgi:excinuclease ABC subunit B
MKTPFQIVSPFAPAGDQPQAVAALTEGLRRAAPFQTLAGVTGSGKTFTLAHVIAAHGRPALVVSHNKTLAAQLFGELKELFPDNAVEYFVSYYDYYQPEAYLPQTDTYIEKDSSINKEIERMRLSATHSLLEREDTIVVASVSCIYGLGSPQDYAEMIVRLRRGDTLNRDALLKRLVDIQYTRNDFAPDPGVFRVRGDTVDVFPSFSETGLRIVFFDNEIEQLRRIDKTTGRVEAELDAAAISPAKHFVMPEDKIAPAAARILEELNERVAWFESRSRWLEAQRLRQRTMFDLEMLNEIGYCSGIENYSRHLSGRAAGEPPATLLDFFPAGFLTVVDESHVTLPQLRAMYNGDQARKNTLIEHGFRLPSARDNRPLNFDEFLQRIECAIFASATPGPFEAEKSAGHIVPQVIRPTGLLDPPVAVRPLDGQIDDLMEEIRAAAAKGDRVLATTLTKRTAEDLAEYLRRAGLRVEYLHSEIDTLDRVDILSRLRRAEFDCLIGINLLREGLDLPEVALVAILDADKEGFLRSESALIQIAGRTARHLHGRVILYADRVTGSMRRMMEVTEQRRQTQVAYNREHGIAPAGILKAVRETWPERAAAADAIERRVLRETTEAYHTEADLDALRKEMRQAADALEYERAAALRDEINELRSAMGPPRGKSGKA